MHFFSAKLVQLMKSSQSGKFVAFIELVSVQHVIRRSRSAQLTVYVLPEDPYIVEVPCFTSNINTILCCPQGESLHATENQRTSIHCVSPGGKPAADVSVKYSHICIYLISAPRFTGMIVRATS